MAVRGQVAKDNVKDKIIAALGTDYIGEYDKKLYTWADDGGQRIQVSLSMTCPKIYKGQDEPLNFEDNDSSEAPAAAPIPPAEITPEEKETLQELMNRLGL